MDSTLLLGVIAAATVVMATVQVGVIVFAARLAQRINRLVDVVEHEIKPTLARMDGMSADVARVTTIASAQAARLDTILAAVATRADDLLSVAHDSVVAPVRHGAAFIMGLRAALLAFRGFRDESQNSAETQTDAHDQPRSRSERANRRPATAR